jgi:hypothetical protein
METEAQGLLHIIDITLHQKYVTCIKLLQIQHFHYDAFKNSDVSCVTLQSCTNSRGYVVLNEICEFHESFFF